MKLDLYKELYFWEWSRKESLESSASLPVGLLSALAGSALYLLRTFPYDTSAVSILFGFAVGAAVVALCIAAIFLSKSLRSDWYDQVPSSQKLRAYYDELVTYHERSPKDADSDFEQYLEERFAEATDVNRRNNGKTGGALHHSTTWLIVAFVCLGVSLVPYLYQSFTTPTPPERVNIQGSVECTQHEVHQMPTDRPQQQPPATPAQPAVPPATIPQRPVGPRNEQTRIQQRPQGPPNEQIRKGGETRDKPR